MAKEPESVSESAMNLFLTNIGMSKEEFDNYIDLGPRHLKYYSPTALENLTNRLFNIRNAGHY